jgi:hypothetical protein
MYRYLLFAERVEVVALPCFPIAHQPIQRDPHLACQYGDTVLVLKWNAVLVLHAGTFTLTENTLKKQTITNQLEQ